MKLTKLAYIGFYINAAIESGKYNKITTKQVKKAINNGKLFGFLEKRLGNDIDLSLYDKTDRRIINETFMNLTDIDDTRLCPGKSGLSLLIAYIFELMQHKKVYLD